MLIPTQLLIALIIVTTLALLSLFKRLFHVVFIFSLFVSAYYFYWRINYTLNTADWIGFSISLVLLIAEIYSFIVQEVLMYYTTSGPTNPVAPEVTFSLLPTVDIFLPIYNEPAGVLYKTVIGCLALDYPAGKLRIHILDDGNREDVKQLALSLGCNHIPTLNNKDGKAGKINNAIKHTDGEMIAFFDCDHIPVKSFLKETVGFFFTSPKVAFVQTAQHFYNENVMEKNLEIERNKIRDGEFFHHIVQPGRDRYNSAFFTGTGAIFRRSALEEIGGVKTETLVEDLHTSIALHLRGYKSVYLNKSLSAGLAPESFADFLKQRRRWTRGSIQVLVLENPLFKHGLTLHQKLNYLALFVDHFQGIPIIIFLCAPLTGLLFNYPPIITDPLSFVTFFMSRLLIQKINLTMLYRGYMNAFWGRVYGAAISFTLTLAAVATLFKPKGHVFEVTPKGQNYGERNFSLYLIKPQLVLFALHLYGIGLGLYQMARTLDFIILINLLWAGYNIIILTAVIASTIEDPEKRKSVRLGRVLTCKLAFNGIEVFGHSTDLSEGGMRLTLEEPVDLPNTPFLLSIIGDAGKIIEVKGVVARDLDGSDSKTSVGIRFMDLDQSSYRSLIEQLYSPINIWDSPGISSKTHNS